MANIKVKDLAACDESGSFIRDLSDAELELQGGGVFGFVKSLVKAVVGVFKAIDNVIDVLTGSGGGGRGGNENVKHH